MNVLSPQPCQHLLSDFLMLKVEVVSQSTSNLNSLVEEACGMIFNILISYLCLFF